jgi:type IV secretory pathway VirB2 component (pilin)
MSEALLPPELPPEAWVDIARAAALLERPALVARIAAFVGLPVRQLAEWLSEPLGEGLVRPVQAALQVAVRAAERSAPGRAPFGLAPEAWQRGLVVAAGAFGGAFGLKGTLAELPLTTTLLLRDILAVAEQEAEPPASRAAEALKVFALGSRSEEDDDTGTGYFALRLAFADALAKTSPATLAQAAPDAVSRLLGLVAQRYTGPVAAKLAALAVPLVGAAAGAGLNLLFRRHYCDVARGHFLLRRWNAATGQS